MSVRVRPADLARMLGVSRSAVTKWVQAGKIALGPDGKLDPDRAVRSLVATTHPGRLKVQVLRFAGEDHAALRQRIASLESELRDVRERSKTNTIPVDGAGGLYERANELHDALLREFDRLIRADAMGPEILDSAVGEMIRTFLLCEEPDEDDDEPLAPDLESLLAAVQHPDKEPSDDVERQSPDPAAR